MATVTLSADEEISFPAMLRRWRKRRGGLAARGRRAGRMPAGPAADQ